MDGRRQGEQKNGNIYRWNKTWNGFTGDKENRYVSLIQVIKYTQSEITAILFLSQLQTNTQTIHSNSIGYIIKVAFSFALNGISTESVLIWENIFFFFIWTNETWRAQKINEKKKN